MWTKSPQEKTGHNRGPTEQSYYWVSKHRLKHKFWKTTQNHKLKKTCWFKNGKTTRHIVPCTCIYTCTYIVVCIYIYIYKIWGSMISHDIIFPYSFFFFNHFSHPQNHRRRGFLSRSVSPTAPKRSAASSAGPSRHCGRRCQVRCTPWGWWLPLVN